MSKTSSQVAEALSIAVGFGDLYEFAHLGGANLKEADLHEVIL